ncbi:hypothetical protein FHP25_28410 [Vineibacter terrae]|uniref:Uncharacterized protein n=1 Tax=Vineibacter terrae TaxID=2586908 RepID=A0A5C8PDW1_9HYPH|nr:hypothetical protein [Vineibacter terrae]TXL71794.1 hypothetical protein FHP25_28410 [Vineibacter terrae]
MAKTYTTRGGGGISAIAQNSTTTFTVQIAQEGRKDLLNYTVKIGADGKNRCRRTPTGLRVEPVRVTLGALAGPYVGYPGLGEDRSDGWSMALQERNLR